MSVKSVTQTLLDEFRSRPTLRAGSLIITVFGDAVAPRGGTVWIGSLIKVLADFGVSERLVRTSVYRLIKDDWLTVDQQGRRSYYSLSPEGERRFDQATTRIYGEPRQSWSGDWCLVLLADLDAEQKELARRELRWLGFGAISTSVLAHPSPDIAELETSLKQNGLQQKLLVMQGRTLGKNRDEALRDLVHKSWNLAEIDDRYASFVDRFRPALKALRKSVSCDSRNAFLIRTLLLQEYRKTLLRDPLLPAELLPANWHGTAAYQLCRNLYRLVCEQADDYMSSELETADGPLPLPSAEFYERFGGLK
ncbi:MAG: phenylacetic acid degradation operon negative regulatory protein [Woeseiaceae bacterium]|jgi:phenylacetic acid degradation operon negative regulatory protein